MKTLAGGERSRLLPAFVELVGEPVKQSGTGAPLDENQRRRLAIGADAVEQEEDLIVSPVQAVVLAARGVNLDPVDLEEGFDLSVGASMIALTRQPSAAFASIRSTKPAMTLGMMSSIRSAAARRTSAVCGASRSDA
jgi:hypothetical protein